MSPVLCNPKCFIIVTRIGSYFPKAAHSYIWLELLQQIVSIEIIENILMHINDFA